MNKDIILILGKSGNGKTSLEEFLVRSCNFKKCVSHTTREIRDEETDGIDYNFVDVSTMNKMILDKRIVEHSSIFGNLYGVSRKELDKSGTKVLVVDTEGLKQILNTVDNNRLLVVRLYTAEATRIKRLENRNDDRVKSVINGDDVKDIYETNIDLSNVEVLNCGNHFDMSLMDFLQQSTIKILKLLNKGE